MERKAVCYADTALIPMGVTTAVDAGSCGSANYESFLRAVVPTSRVRFFSFINIAPDGLIVTRLVEELDPRHYDEPRIAELMDRYRGQCLGLKLRFSKELVGRSGRQAARPDARSRRSAQVHDHRPHDESADRAGRHCRQLRPDDVYCHMYQGTGETIVGSSGHVGSRLLAAGARA